MSFSVLLLEMGDRSYRVLHGGDAAQLLGALMLHQSEVVSDMPMPWRVVWRSEFDDADAAAATAGRIRRMRGADKRALAEGRRKMPRLSAPTASGTQDADFMRQALQIAAQVAELGEVPVGAILVDARGEVLARFGNEVEARRDPTAHAEVLCVRAAAARLGNHRLAGCCLYVTLEPCAMCAMALVHARVARVVYASRDPKTGADGSVLSVLRSAANNHRPAVSAGLLATESATLLQAFFQARRHPDKAAADGDNAAPSREPES